MKYFQEVTQWSGSVQNHVYYLTDDKRKMIGYIKHGTSELFKFSKPMNFDTKGCKFVVLSTRGDSVEVYFPKTVDKPIGQVTEVAGSNGKTYFVSKFGNKITCTCPGFMFRHNCRHTKET